LFKAAYFSLSICDDYAGLTMCLSTKRTLRYFLSTNISVNEESVDTDCARCE